ncbi:hypothetical protein IGS74_18825 [Aureimonas sp. OT7]|uniref:hypothetical protein n=1 Tax=Aureimonas sp. OT7 TaxID=2816454 RepID=UPI00178652CC|nr:hypothetical protein [Aureimonas sp. OT7]QOG06536.1 hypothetical protein IGS74_18825 [Aureimonas sp. OT7]
MAVYLVTWDLNRQRQNYAEARARLIQHLQRYENIKDDGLDSVVFVSSTADANAVCTDIRAVLADSDKLVVTRMVAGQHQGWMAPNVWNWINVRL